MKGPQLPPSAKGAVQLSGPVSLSGRDWKTAIIAGNISFLFIENDAESLFQNGLFHFKTETKGDIL